MATDQEVNHRIIHLNSPQKRIWFLSNLENGSVAYNNHSFFLVNGYLNLNTLKEAFELLIFKHPSLRSSFVLSDSDIYQKVFKGVGSINLFEYYDKSSLSLADIDDFLVSLTKRKFDLFSDKLFFFTMIKRSNSSCFLGLVAHHIITDGFSFQFFFSDLFQYYNDLLLGKSPYIRNYDKEYFNYAIVRKELETSLEALNFWESAFANWDTSAITRLNYDFEMKTTKSYKGKRLRFSVDKEQVLNIKSLAFKARTGVLPVFLMVHFIFFHKALRQKQIVIGTVLGGRSQQNQKLIGMFVNTVPCRITIDPTLSFLESLNQFLPFFNNAYKYQNFPLDDIIKDLNIIRSLNSNPLFENIFILQPKKETYFIDNMTFENYRVDRNVSLFDTTLEATETKNQDLILEWEFDSSLFEEDTIEAYHSCYKKIFNTVLSNPSVLIKDIRII